MDRLLTSKEAADLLGVTVRTIQRMCRRKEITHHVVGRLYKIPLTAVEEFGKVLSEPQDREPYRKRPEPIIGQPEVVRGTQRPPTAEPYRDDSELSEQDRIRRDTERSIANATCLDHVRIYRAEQNEREAKWAQEKEEERRLKAEKEPKPKVPGGVYENPTGA